MALPVLVAEEVQRFIAQHNLDEAARTKLESLSLEQQVDVISQDSTNVRNMNAVVISRSSKSQKEGPQFTGNTCVEYVNNLVARFIEAHGLDEKACVGLKNLPPREQVAVMARDLEGVNNPSGVVDSRVRKAQSGAAMAAQAQPGLLPATACTVDSTQFLEQAYVTFINEYGLDQKSQDAVAGLSHLEKLEVISQSMENVWNPSGAISARAAKVKEHPVVLGPRAMQWVFEVSQLFCQSNGIDLSSDAYQMLQKLPADKQFEVCAQNLAGARNPGSVLFCRIAKMTGQALPPGAGGGAPALPAVAAAPGVPRAVPPIIPAIGQGGGVVNWDVDHFVATYSLDERAANVLRDLNARDPTGAAEVMNQPITPDVRNPSGVVHARVMKVTGAKARLGMPAVTRSSPY